MNLSLTDIKHLVINVHGLTPPMVLDPIPDLDRATGTLSPAPLVILNPADLLRRALDMQGNVVAAGSAGHVMTELPQAGLIFDIRTPKRVTSIAEARSVAADCDLLGRKGDWVVGEDYETQLLVDRRFHAPAVDKAAFPNMPSEGLVYTNRTAAWSPDRVWFVDLSHGRVSWYHDGYEGLVVPVLRVPASQ